jgi:hypothetical protein
MSPIKVAFMEKKVGKGERRGEKNNDGQVGGGAVVAVRRRREGWCCHGDAMVLGWG